MQILKRGLSFYVFGNVHVAITAYCLTKISFLQFDINDQPLANFVFFSTVLSYNFIRLFQIDKINSMMAIWIRANKKPLIVLNALSLIGSLYYISAFEYDEIIALLPFILATILYVFPFNKGSAGLRNVPGLKLFLISMTWTGLTLYLPLVSAGIPLTQDLYPYVIQRFLFVLAIAIPFDIRDVQFDIAGLNTLPQVLGVNKSKIIAVVALVIVGIMHVLESSDDSTYIWIDLSIICLSVVMVVFSGINRKRYYTAFWIEGLPILWYLLYLVLA